MTSLAPDNENDMIRSTATTALLFIFLSAGCPLPAAEPVQVNVRDFGALGDGHTNDGPALHRAIVEGIRRGPGTTVFLPKGRYHLESSGGKHLDIRDAKGLTVRGEAGTILVAQDPDAQIVGLTHCTGTTVRDLTLEQDRTYFTQGTVVAMEPDGKACEVTIDRRYDEPDAPHLAQCTTLRSFSQPDTSSYRQDRWWPTVREHTRIGERRWRLAIDGWALVPSMVGKPFIIWDDKHGGHGLSIDACADCLVQDVDYHGRGTNAGLFITGCPGTITMRRFNIGVVPGSDALLSCSGGGQQIDCRGDLVYEECWFDKVDDDGADILTGYDRVLTQVGPRVLTLQGGRDYRPGDHVAIVDWKTRVDRHKATVVGAVPGAGRTLTLTLDRDVTIVRAGPGQDGGKQNGDGIDRVTDYNLACASATFRKCRIQALRARGLNLKAQHCLIEDCLFYDCEMPAISGGPELWWGEAPAINHLTIRNNRFVNCNSRCIDIAYCDGGPDCVAQDNRDILIQGNTFTHCGAHGTIHQGFTPQCPIRISNADGVVIRDNVFADAVAPDRPVRVLIEHSGAVTLAGNQNLPDTAILRR